MADNIEVYEDGSAAFASLRVPAWHALGEVFLKPVKTAEMIRKAHLNKWNVRVEELTTPGTSHRKWYAVVRDNPVNKGTNGKREINTLGVVGERYNVVQNEDLFQFGDDLLEAGRWETAGSIKNGTVVFASLALDREVILDPTGVADKINTYLLIHTSHDGSVAVQASVTPVRVVCQNTLNMALRGAKQTFKVRHTQKVDEKVQVARETLGLAAKHIDVFEKEAKALIETPVDAKMFHKIITTLYPAPEKDTKGAMTKWTNKVDAINTIYTGETNGMIAGSAWGALNALTERLDWYRNGRGENADANAAAAASGFDVATNAQKALILKTVKGLAGVK